MSPDPRPFDLRQLIAPIDVEAFSASHWEREPLVVQRDDPSYYDELLSLADADHVLAHSSVNSSAIRIVKHGRDVPLAKLRSANQSEGGLEALYQEYRDGATVVLTFLHERWPPLRALCQALSTETSAAVQVNVYITPPSSQGLATHYDSHDVFVVQIGGSKHWQVFDSPTRLPLPEDRYDADAAEPPGAPRHDLILGTGDMLYIPRGWVHAAASVDSFSVHLTIGIKTITWASLIRRAVESALRQEPELRESLPMGFAAGNGHREDAEARLRALVATALERVDVQGVVTEAFERARAHRHPSLAGHLQDLGGVGAIDVETSLRVRPHMEVELRNGSGAVELEFHGKRMRLPAQAGPAARFIVESDIPFTPRDLPGPLDDESGLVLLRRMVKEGLLTTAGG